MTDQELIDKGYMDGKKSFDYLMKGIAENFDFKKVYEVMKLLNWGWSVNRSDELYIPTVKAIQMEVLSLCKQAYDEEINVSTGGFTICYADNALSISFCIEEYYSD